MERDVVSYPMTELVVLALAKVGDLYQESSSPKPGGSLQGFQAGHSGKSPLVVLSACFLAAVSYHHYGAGYIPDPAE
jgi:hypothetical protein